MNCLSRRGLAVGCQSVVRRSANDTRPVVRTHLAAQQSCKRAYATTGVIGKPPPTNYYYVPQIHKATQFQTRQPRQLLQRRTAATGKTVKPKISAAHKGPTLELPYGMRRIDYATSPPGTWPMPPPPPASGNIVSRNAYGIVVASVVGLFAMIVLNRDDSVQDYWKAVEQGHFPEDDDDDDDDLLDDDEDEWDEKKDAVQTKRG